MDRRYSLAAVIVILIGGAIYLWLHPEGASLPPLSPSSSAASVQPDEPSQPARPAQPDQPGKFGLYVLAITWFPTFCELKPNVSECRNPTAQQNARFALHGLWPGDGYCGVSAALQQQDLAGGWNNLPAVDLSDATWAALRTAMPGTKSHLERHEWLAHGTCSGASADTYFRRAAELIGAINATAIPQLFAQSSGSLVTRTQVQSAFDQAFGAGAGKRVRLGCDEDDSGHTLLDELTIALYGDVTADTSFKSLILKAHPRNGGCDGGDLQ